jgi:hypothetical protein
MVGSGLGAAVWASHRHCDELPRPTGFELLAGHQGPMLGILCTAQQLFHCPLPAWAAAATGCQLAYPAGMRTSRRRPQEHHHGVV